MNLLTINNQFMLMFTLISFTLITLYFYLRICYKGLMLKHYEPLWISEFQVNKIQMNLYLLTSSISLLELPLISLIYTMS